MTSQYQKHSQWFNSVPECGRGYLREVHGCDSGVESRVDPDDEASEDEEEVRVGVLGRDQAHPRHRHQDVVQQQAALIKEQEVSINLGYLEISRQYCVEVVLNSCYIDDPM